MRAKAAATILALAVVAGCGGSATDDGTTVHVPGQAYDAGFACHGKTGVYTTRRGGIAVLANDPECKA